MDKLTGKQRRFIQEYLVDLCGAKAAVRAGYSPKGAKQMADTLLRKHHIKAIIDKKIMDRSNKLEIKQDQVLSELANIAFGDIRNVLRWDKTISLRPSEELNSQDVALIAEISENGKDGGLRIKRSDKIKALELLGKHLGMFDATGKANDPIHTTSTLIVGEATKDFIEQLQSVAANQ